MSEEGNQAGAQSAQAPQAADSKNSEATGITVKCLKTFSSPTLGGGNEGQVIQGMDPKKAKKLVEMKVVEIIK